ncbi:OmpW/AlkL family protein [Sphaerotilus sp.]|uniref:OmpW/AlkL family protein n=1 Tax=Sphaerotilus sp. TaxID=2093942 RepID=UPI002ACDB9C0|nr:OmpW family outer membrane protein [Sphaerotilus sp.]MDZ7858891.1 OmpW family outer membrane protein [Sphaerotilus sp.]
MKKLCFALAAVAALAAAPAASAQVAGDLLVRGRLVNIDPANKDSIAITDISVSNKVIPEVDVTYFLSPNLAAELILTYPQKHNVSSSAHGGQIGTLKHLPPTLTLQYHFTDLGLGAFKPYVGAGLNYTRFSSVNLPAGFSIEKNSVGLALQAGVDYMIDKNWSVNLDVKKVTIRTDLSSNGTNLGTIKVDPLLIGVGVGYKF